ncbi:MAG: glycoside hydrolase family 28 protein [Roseburia sp.]|nr:glycoside hydrolase family 28 protein [Roseburia sp.]MCM1099644.1 glycoside hydrolase family 28 protein [Ruminococcus flavefaciens]
MELRTVMVTSRSAVIEIPDGGRYFSAAKYRILLNGRAVLVTERTVVSLYDLKPDTDYTVEILEGAQKRGRTDFRTAHESVTLDVRRFGARGDGLHDDTQAIQAAILACPEDGRVLIPGGTYRIVSLFLKSHTRIELAEGAELLAFTDREKFPVFPGMIQGFDEEREYNLGSWEGNPLPIYTGIICGVNVEDVTIYGEGTINGNASKENWWKNPKGYKDVFRPRLFFINGCRNVTLQGVTCCNSPSWTLHPYFSNDLRFIDLNIKNPSDSPNTDGLDPESCRNVEILGVRFSLGDDCIAVKSGKIYMGKTYKTPSENIRIRQCLMEDGHGAVTLGSEMAGGIINLTVEDCIFRHTDRGLRIKTRRGRGKDAVLNDIVFRNLDLDHVMTPLVVNSFYFCDPDGRTPYVQSREVYPVDDRTPSVRRLVFENMKCTNCHVAAAFFDGLPEKKIEEIIMRNISVSYAEDPRCDVPAMSEGVPRSQKRGLYARNVERLILENVTIEGQDGEAFEFEGVGELVRE